mmetsp:Transcript_33995/g.85992  ORF Transcript_33995/g.85992 Transcript_33995/m.85992 type:complete len:173 (-) Transcript_33995:15-533(-)
MWRGGHREVGEIDVRAAHARVVAPQQRQLDDTAISGMGHAPPAPDSLDAASPSITHVPNIKLPFPLASPPWMQPGRGSDATSAPARQRAAPPSAPKVCASPDRQPISDASQYGHISLGPQTFSFVSRQRRWQYVPSASLLQRWRGQDSLGGLHLAGLAASAACFALCYLYVL